jgi:glycosyltransferase involved in cell wall biosynthesis
MDHVLVGVTATMISQKGLFDFLAAADRFRSQSHVVRFVIVGDGELRPALEAKRHELRLEELVIFAGWMADAHEIALPAFDIFFQPSLWEAMSIALLEAMAAAKPVVATRVGEAPHMIEDGADGYLVEPRDVDGMTAALRRLINAPDLRIRLGEAAREKMSKSYSVDKMTRSYEAMYQELAQGSPRIR